MGTGPGLDLSGCVYDRRVRTPPFFMPTIRRTPPFFMPRTASSSPGRAIAPRRAYSVNRNGSFTDVPLSLRMPASGPEATCPNDDVTKYPFDRLRTHCSDIHASLTKHGAAALLQVDVAHTRLELLHRSYGFAGRRELFYFLRAPAGRWWRLDAAAVSSSRAARDACCTDHGLHRYVCASLQPVHCRTRVRSDIAIVEPRESTAL